MRTSSSEPGSRRSGAGFPRSFLLGLVVGVTVCVVFAVGVWIGTGAGGGREPSVNVRGLAQTSPAELSDQTANSAEDTQVAALVEPVRPIKPVNDESTAEMVASLPLEPGDAPNLGDAVREVPVDVEPAEPPAVAPSALEPEKFILHEPPRKEPEPFVLPRDSWFALGRVSAEESLGMQKQVCAVDRSLNTALTLGLLSRRGIRGGGEGGETGLPDPRFGQLRESRVHLKQRPGIQGRCSVGPIGGEVSGGSLRGCPSAGWQL